jgi:hypothetical protein
MDAAADYAKQCMALQQRTDADRAQYRAKLMQTRRDDTGSDPVPRAPTTDVPPPSRGERVSAKAVDDDQIHAAQ